MQLRDAPISLEQLDAVCKEVEAGLTQDTPQDMQYIQLHIRQVRGLLNEVGSIRVKLDAALAAVKDAHGSR